MKKRIFAILLVSSLILSLSACGTPDSASDDIVADTADQKTDETTSSLAGILYYGTEYWQGMDDYIKKFEERSYDNYTANESDGEKEKVDNHFHDIDYIIVPDMDYRTAPIIYSIYQTFCFRYNWRSDVEIFNMDIHIGRTDVYSEKSDEELYEEIRSRLGLEEEETVIDENGFICATRGSRKTRSLVGFIYEDTFVIAESYTEDCEEIKKILKLKRIDLPLTTNQNTK